MKKKIISKYDGLIPLPPLETANGNKLVESSNKQAGELAKHSNNLAVANAQYRHEAEEFFSNMNKKKWTLSDIVLNSKSFKAVGRFQSKIFELTGEERINQLRLIGEARLSKLNEMCNAGIQMIKADSRKRVAETILCKLSELEEVIEERQYKFIERIEKKLIFLESKKGTPIIYNLCKAEAERMIETHLEMNRQIMASYASILDETISIG